MQNSFCALYRCASEVRKTHGNKSEPLTGLVREAHPGET